MAAELNPMVEITLTVGTENYTMMNRGSGMIQDPDSGRSQRIDVQARVVEDELSKIKRPSRKKIMKMVIEQIENHSDPRAEAGRWLTDLTNQITTKLRQLDADEG